MRYRVHWPVELFLPFPAERDAIKPAAHWRSTWVVSSLQTLKQRGHFERYKALLPKEHADQILMTVAGLWMPVAVAHVHYATCDALGLSRDELLEMGRVAGHRGQGTVLKTAVRLAKNGGATPWTGFAQMQRLWDRGADGGGCAVWKVGPKEAVTETVGCSLFDVQYFRLAFSRIVLDVMSLFCTRGYVHDLTPHGSPDTCKLRFQWV